MTHLVRIAHVTKTYQVRQVLFQALRDITLDIATGEFVSIMGHSGSGKSTLLHLVGGLDRPTSGTVQVGENILGDMDESQLARFRRVHVGLVFQFFNLVDNLTVQANVELPALLARRADRRSIRQRSSELLERLGIADQATKHPWELSGGQQQRVAIARALVNRPALLLADEPTGNLDSGSGRGVLDVLSECHQAGQTILMVTHDPLAAARARRIVFIHDGQIVGWMGGGDALQVAQQLAGLA